MTVRSPSTDQLLAIYERMLLIRRMEEKLAADFKAGALPGAVHLYVGQEAIAAGVCAHLTDRDRISSTHRGHGHFLAKGGDPTAMFAEILGRRTGVCLQVVRLARLRRCGAGSSARPSEGRQ